LTVSNACGLPSPGLHLNGRYQQVIDRCLQTPKVPEDQIFFVFLLSEVAPDIVKKLLFNLPRNRAPNNYFLHLT
jgi:hypothetical protein